MKLSDTQMVRLGQGIIAAGIAAFLLPLGEYAALVGLILIGLGCAQAEQGRHQTGTHIGAGHLNPDNCLGLIRAKVVGGGVDDAGEGPHRQADASRHAARAEWHLHQHFQSRRRPYISTLYDGGGSIKVIRS